MELCHRTAKAHLGNVVTFFLQSEGVCDEVKVHRINLLVGGLEGSTSIALAGDTDLTAFTNEELEGRGVSGSPTCAIGNVVLLFLAGERLKVLIAELARDNAKVLYDCNETQVPNLVSV